MTTVLILCVLPFAATVAAVVLLSRRDSLHVRAQSAAYHAWESTGRAQPWHESWLWATGRPAEAVPVRVVAVTAVRARACECCGRGPAAALVAWPDGDTFAVCDPCADAAVPLPVTSGGAA